MPSASLRWRSQCVLLCALAISACTPPREPLPPLSSGTLVMVTVPGPLTYLEQSDGGLRGFEFELAEAFAKSLNVKLNVRLAKSRMDALRAVNEGRAHLAAVAMTRSAIPREFPALAPSPGYGSVEPLLTCTKKRARPERLTALEGDMVLVAADSAGDRILAEHPSRNIDFELRRAPALAGGDVMLGSIERGEVPCAVVESLAYASYRQHDRDIVSAFSLGPPEPMVWLTGPADGARLIDATDKFFAAARKDSTIDRLIERYFKLPHALMALDFDAFSVKLESVLPRYKRYFEEAATLTGIEWTFLAAIGYQESKWDPLATSPTGVRGLMMLTSDTADRMKVKDRLDPRESILGGARYFALLRDLIPARIAEPDRTWIALAAYNQGIGHIEDARILAKRLGKSPDRWEDVKSVLPKLADPDVHRTLKFGFARGPEAVAFTENVKAYAELLRRHSSTNAAPEIARVQALSE